MKKQNKLAQSNSPYLRQHADNPVEWFEWGTEALSKSKNENKPMLISIGYAACHWCHVMARESFSNDQIANFMNDNFVCIKVDREERPDLDQIYMEAAQLISGRGGWPLNAFVMPTGKPFYAASYFPPDQWLTILQQLSYAYTNEPDKIRQASQSLTEGINHNPLNIELDVKTYSKIDLELYFNQHVKLIDLRLGGYAGSPKFMLPIGLEFFLQYHFHTGNTDALKAVTHTLDAMAKGGIFDQIGGGFARYSTDSNWLVPHFEKMLYDNAQLISLYSKAYRVTKKNTYKAVVHESISFIERELRDSSGGFYASINADSEHEEGKFYVWTKHEIESILEPQLAEIIIDYYQIAENGNWEYGKNILHSKSDKKTYADAHNFSENEFDTLLHWAKNKLLITRNKRTRPSTDDKIICAWNALMISAYIEAYKATGVELYLQRAIETSIFVETNLLSESGQLFRIFINGNASTLAFLDDYSITASAFIDLYEITFDSRWLELSKKLTDYAIIHFLNESKDMFYYTSDEAEGLIARKYEYSDNVIPASNSVLARSLHKLAHLYENNEYANLSRNMFSKIQPEIQNAGPYFANWALYACSFVFPFYEVSIMGSESRTELNKLKTHYLPNTVVAGGEVENLPILKDRLKKRETLIYLCENKTCIPPFNKVENALKIIEQQQ